MFELKKLVIIIYVNQVKHSFNMGVYTGDSDVLVARDRLKGALRELLQHSDTGSSADSGEECSTQDYRHSMKKM